VVCACEVGDPEFKNTMMVQAYRVATLGLPSFIPTVLPDGNRAFFLYEVGIVAPPLDFCAIMRFGIAGILKMCLHLHTRGYTCVDIDEKTFVWSQDAWFIRNSFDIVDCTTENIAFGKLAQPIIDALPPRLDVVGNIPAQRCICIYACIKMISAIVLREDPTCLTMEDCGRARHLLRNKEDAEWFESCRQATSCVDWIT